jgi:hypothetical protein
MTIDDRRTLHGHAVGRRGRERLQARAQDEQDSSGWDNRAGCPSTREQASSSSADSLPSVGSPRNAAARIEIRTAAAWRAQNRSPLWRELVAETPTAEAMSSS